MLPFLSAMMKEEIYFRLCTFFPSGHLGHQVIEFGCPNGIFVAKIKSTWKQSLVFWNTKLMLLNILQRYVHTNFHIETFQWLFHDKFPDSHDHFFESLNNGVKRFCYGVKEELELKNKYSSKSNVFICKHLVF